MKNKTIIIGLTVSLLLSTTAGRAAYTPTLEDDSIYEITNVSSAEEADFSLVEIDENGQAAVTYYKYNIKEGAVSHEPLDEDMKGQDITGNFFGQTGGNGAAITNRTDTVFNSWDIGNITGDFVNNSVEGNLFNGPQGGAISTVRSTAAAPPSATSPAISSATARFPNRPGRLTAAPFTTRPMPRHRQPPSAILPAISSATTLQTPTLTLTAAQSTTTAITKTIWQPSVSSAAALSATTRKEKAWLSAAPFTLPTT